MPPDTTLPELRRALAPLVAANAGFDGWTPAARDMAADGLGVDRDIAALALPHAIDMIDAWFAHIDAAMLDRLGDRLGNMKVRQRITALVETRLEVAASDRDAMRRAVAVLALPGNIARAARLGWRAADAMWRAAGDIATDYNHYTKRAILAAVYGATVTVFLDDESEEFADTRAFLARRIDGIMRFEKAKAQLLATRDYLPSPSRFVGRLRYPAA